MSLFESFTKGLKKTRDSLMSSVQGLFRGTKIDEALFDELEEMLILADVGVGASEAICGRLRARVREEGLSQPQDVYNTLKAIIREILTKGEVPIKEKKPHVVLVIGVNGSGKTTTVGKLAALYRRQGRSVLLAAADTFRAAAIEQLEIWAERAGAEIIKQAAGSDPAAVVHDAILSAKARGTDVVLCDTAGRLHNKKHLMEELSKIGRVVNNLCADASVEVLLVIDATTGQNGLAQARLFREAAGVTSVVLTKLDGTAKGGVVIAMADELGLPIRYIGCGEKVDDLQPFDAQVFAEALFDTGVSA